MVKVPANGFLLKALFLACRWQLLTMTSLGLFWYMGTGRERVDAEKEEEMCMLSASLLMLINH